MKCRSIFGGGPRRTTRPSRSSCVWSSTPCAWSRALGCRTASTPLLSALFGSKKLLVEVVEAMAEYFVSEQLQAVAAARGESCSKMRARLLQVARTLTLATACSGTDSPVAPGS